MIALSPAEQLALLDPKAVKAKDAVKATLLSLVAQGVLKIETTSTRGFFGTKKATTVSVARDATPDGPHAAALVRVVRDAGSGGAPLAGVAKGAREAWGDDLRQFLTGYVFPSLTRRGLLTESSRKVAFFFHRTVYDHTPAGAMERIRVLGPVQRARTIPALLRENPAEAAAIALAAGSTLLIVPELKAFYGQLAALGPRGAGGSWSSGDGWPSTTFDPGSFDASSLSSFDSSDFSSFDSSFDSSFSGSDSGGGDSGGGDGGGGGGD